jgi:hypothetical protein
MARVGFVQLGFRLPVNVDDELKRFAYEMGQSKSSLVTDILIEWMNNRNSKSKPQEVSKYLAG